MKVEKRVYEFEKEDWRTQHASYYLEIEDDLLTQDKAISVWYENNKMKHVPLWVSVHKTTIFWDHPFKGRMVIIG